MPKLLLFLQDGDAREILFDKDRITIGRRSDNDVTLPYPSVSGRHTIISYLSADKCFVEDMKSTNGTLLNGSPIFERKQLKDRDQVDIGGQKIVFLEGIKAAQGAAADTGDKEAAPLVLGAPSALRLTPSHEYLSARPTIPAEPMQLTEEDLEEEEALSGLHFPTIIKASSGEKKLRRQAVQKEVPPLPTLDAGLVPLTEEHFLKMTEGIDDSALTALDEPVYTPPPVVAMITAMAGSKGQRQLPLRYGEYVLGRPGFQLAVIRVSEEGCCLLPMEGEPPLELRGQKVPPEGLPLADQDIFTVGRSPLLFQSYKEGEDSAALSGEPEGEH